MVYATQTSRNALEGSHFYGVWASQPINSAALLHSQINEKSLPCGKEKTEAQGFLPARLMGGGSLLFGRLSTQWHKEAYILKTDL